MAYQQESIKPYNQTEGKAKQVEKMFDNIAPTYDCLNHTLSLGIDRRWRKHAIDSLKAFSPQTILDIATGTGDFAIMAAERLKPRQLIGADISQEMMEIARQKVEERNLGEVISFQREDCMQLSFDDNRFDAVTVSYGVRNFENLDKGLREIHRVLKPGGHLLLVELAAPDKFPMKQLFWLYSHLAIPLIGCFFSRDMKAYSYLTQSVQAFPKGEIMEGIIRNAGFEKVTWKRFTFGISTMYIGEK